MRPIFTTTMSFRLSEKSRLEVLKKHRIRYIDIFRVGMEEYERRLGVKVPEDSEPVKTAVIAEGDVIQSPTPKDQLLSLVHEEKYEI